MEKITKLANIVAKAARMEKKAEEIEPGSIYEKAKAILPEEDIDHHETDLYLRVSPKSTELVNSMKYRNSGMITTFKDNIDGDMWYDLPFCYPYVDSREYRNVPSKEEDEIILRQKKSSKKVKLTKKASMADIEIKIKQEKDYYMVYMGTVDSSGIKKKCKNTFEIVETLRNYVENRIMESK